jgi:hypothetical protein
MFEKVDCYLHINPRHLNQQMIYALAGMYQRRTLNQNYKLCILRLTAPNFEPKVLAKSISQLINENIFKFKQVISITVKSLRPNKKGKYLMREIVRLASG